MQARREALAEINALVLSSLSTTATTATTSTTTAIHPITKLTISFCHQGLKVRKYKSEVVFFLFLPVFNMFYFIVNT